MEKKTPLYEAHLAAGGKMVPFGGYVLPVQYGQGVIAEHQAVRTACGIFDVSHKGEFLLTGALALESLNRLAKMIAENEATTCRYRILRFNDEILHDQKHSKEHFDQILEDITRYEKFCAEHPEYENNKAILAIENIKRVYKRCSDEGTFL